MAFTGLAAIRHKRKIYTWTCACVKCGSENLYCSRGENVLRPKHDGRGVASLIIIIIIFNEESFSHIGGYLQDKKLKTKINLEKHLN